MSIGPTRRGVVAVTAALASVAVASPAVAAPHETSPSDAIAGPTRSAVRDDPFRCRFGPFPRIARDGPCPFGGWGARSDVHPGAAAVAEQQVIDQQRALNRLFDGFGIAPLTLDGDPGRVTRQRLCAFRLAVGLPVSTAEMGTGSLEEAMLFGLAELPVPESEATESGRWILIDQRCQIMFVGDGAEHLQFVFPTSTGRRPFATRRQDRTAAYRYNPASHNGGWHNSLTYPAAADNPRNGNMYRPLYFDGGQAIHGAGNVPRSPASKGCARLRVAHQDELLDWLGLLGRGATRDRNQIGVSVTVQGSWEG